MKTAVLLSGGVDSSVALMTLVEQGLAGDITAYYLKIWLEDELASLGTCPWREDLEYAEAVCAVAGVPLKVISLQRAYRESVVAYTVDELKAGRTPNPDIFCNRLVKFGVFLDRVGDSVDKVASGHYAIVDRGPDELYRIRRSPDPVKDQTYFLSHLTQEQAALALFPIGSLTKNEVRKKAEMWNLPNKSRADSQGLCFLGKIRYQDFVCHYLGEKKGPIIEAKSGHMLGTHRGSWFYTIGQRGGLGLSGGPWYVVDKKDNIVTVADSFEAERAARREFTTAAPHWIAAPPSGTEVKIKLRHGPKMTAASLSPAAGGSGLRVRMAEDDRGVAPGQFAVFYEGDICLGGGRIDNSSPQV